MYKHVAISCNRGLIKVKRNFEDDGVWEKLALYFNYLGIESNSLELKNVFSKAFTSLKNTKSSNDIDVDIEDVFFKVFKKYKYKAKKKHIRELSVLYQVLTTERVDVSKKMQTIVEFGKEAGINLYGIAVGQRHEMEREMKATMMCDDFYKVYTSNALNSQKASKNLLDELIKEQGVKPSKVLYITNSVEEVEIARESGVALAYLGDEDVDANVSGNHEAIIAYIKKR